MVLKLFILFAKIGAFSIGGGYAMLPFIQREVIEKNHWMTFQEFSDILAISQMTPGPIAINSATFVGYKLAGIWGSIFATLGVVLPSFLMIILIASFFTKVYEKEQVKRAFIGIRPAIVGLIAFSAYGITKTNVVDFKSSMIFILGFGSLFIKKMDPVFIIIISAIIGIIVY